MKQKTLLLAFLGIMLSLAACSPQPAAALQPTAQQTPTGDASTPTPEALAAVETDDWTITRFTPTPSPTPTRPTPVTTDAAHASILPPGEMLLTTNIGYDMALIDAGTGTAENLFPGQRFAEFIEWRDRGCQLVMRSWDGDYELLTLQGERVETLFRYSELEKRGLDPYGSRVFFSPDGQRLWFWQVSGRPYDEMGPESRYEVQDIYTISRDLNEGPYRLTTGGGGWLGSWSPDGQRIAFSDYDEHGIIQVFVSDGKGEEKTQITQFQQPGSFDAPGTEVERIEWSPDGSKLAVAYSTREDQNQRWATVIVDPQKGEAVFENDAMFLWWVDNATVVLHVKDQPGEEEIRVQNIRSGQPGYSIRDVEYPYFSHIQPFGDTHLAGFIAQVDEWQFFVFNTRHGSVISFPDVRLPMPMINWAITPAEFPGMDLCGK